MMVTDARRDRSGGRSFAATTPFVGWKHRRAAVSARKLATSLWRLAETNPGDGSVRWQSFDRLGFQFCSSLPPVPKCISEGATKWDYLDGFDSINVKLKQELVLGKSVNDEEETASSLKKFAEVMKSERKMCKVMNKMNSALVNDIAETKSSARKFIRNLRKEKKAREELEDLCYDLGKQIRGRKAQIGALRNQQTRIVAEVEQERRMQQMAEEKAQIKLAHANFIFADKYDQINGLIAHLTSFFHL